VTLFRKEAGSGVGEVGGREGEKKRITKREREREGEREERKFACPSPSRDTTERPGVVQCSYRDDPVTSSVVTIPPRLFDDQAGKRLKSDKAKP